jgi:hypothetical protein
MIENGFVADVTRLEYAKLPALSCSFLIMDFAEMIIYLFQGQDDRLVIKVNLKLIG